MLNGVQRRLGHLAHVAGAVPAAAQEQTGPRRRVIAAQAGEILACIGPDGSCEWSMPIGQCHDLFVLPSGNILTQDGWSRVVEYNPDRSEILCAPPLCLLILSCNGEPQTCTEAARPHCMPL
eukprot:SAG11_NODE_786_length_7172_cov_3.635939_6_plen_122_part_00